MELTRRPPTRGRGLGIAVGAAAIVAPALHSWSDLLELARGGYSPTQLWINYAAFVLMPWILLGLCAVHRPSLGGVGITGALLYGAAFAYFQHTTLYALIERTPTYEELWRRLGVIYTIHGAVMVVGGFLFALAAWNARWLPRWAVAFFLAGLTANLALALLPTPEILQNLGSALRNLGLIGMGATALRSAGRQRR